MFINSEHFTILRRAVITLLDIITFADKIISIKRLCYRLRTKDLKPININTSIYQLFNNFDNLTIFIYNKFADNKV
ncbi:hypothetical protein ACU52_14165 [Xylanibacter rarus]|uniref:Uncharacterized protein n=1 Tax=Xylanibacter rarus TaxID=1676614 RepID=A0A8E1UPN2_9BACT|nr:hypothetical protein ACU52_14165 [Xylanibacter rarus]